LAALALSLTFLGAAPIGEIKASQLSVTVVSLASLSVYLLPLIALMLSFDALVGEMERGTLLLILTYPLARWQLVAGKFLGHLVILAFAITLGYGSAAVLIVFLGGGDEGGWRAFWWLLVSSVLLGSVFAALGQLISTVVRERATAVGFAIGSWLGLVVLYDLALLGVLLTDWGQMLGSNALAVILALNPADAYRVFNLTGSEGAGLVSGMAALETSVVPGGSLLLGVMLAWLVAFLASTIALLERKEL
jgi:Cu-processing system permease protein